MDCNSVMCRIWGFEEVRFRPYWKMILLAMGPRLGNFVFGPEVVLGAIMCRAVCERLRL